MELYEVLGIARWESGGAVRADGQAGRNGNKNQRTIEREIAKTERRGF